MSCWMYFLVYITDMQYVCAAKKMVIVMIYLFYPNAFFKVHTHMYTYIYIYNIDVYI